MAHLTDEEKVEFAYLTSLDVLNPPSKSGVINNNLSFFILIFPP